MKDENRIFAVGSDQAIRRDPIGLGERALRPFGYASSALVRPIPSTGTLSGISFPRLTLATAGWAGGVRVRTRTRSRRASAARIADRSSPASPEAVLPRPWPAKAARPEGPPWLYGYVLYDGTMKDLGDLIRSNLFALDRHTADKVLLSYIGNPKEVGPFYDVMRDAGLRRRDEKDACALSEEQQAGLGADYLRLREVDKLIELTGIECDKLPCIAFFPNPFCDSPAILHVRPEWILSASARRDFSLALLSFFEITDVESLAKNSQTNAEFARSFERLIVDYLEDRIWVEAVEGTSTETCIFQNNGRTWLVQYAGVRQSIGHSLGMTYISHLLRNPGQLIRAADLRGIAAGRIDDARLGSAGNRLDDPALSDYRQKLRDLQEEKHEAEENHDLGRIQQLDEDMEMLIAEIGLATGLHGRKRKAADDHERARKSVSKAIRGALRAIKGHHTPLWHHLDKFLEIGLTLTYRPERPTPWST